MHLVSVTFGNSRLSFAAAVTEMKQTWWRTGVSGVIAGVVFSLLSGITFYDIGVRLGILFNPSYQSPIVLAIVPTMVMAKAPYVIFSGWTVILIGYAFLFARIRVLWWPDIGAACGVWAC